MTITTRKKPMKPFINKTCLLAICVLCAACSVQAKEKAAEPAAQPQKPAQTQTAAAKDPVQLLREWDAKLNTLETAFEQTSSYDGVVISRSHGKLYYKKAGNLLRLDTLDDDQKTDQSAVTDKKVLKVLDAKGKVITSGAWADWVNGQPNKALFDFGNYSALLDAHRATVFSSSPQRVILLLTPKDESDYKLYLLLDPKEYFPQTIIIEADLMQTKADLKNTVKNKSVSQNLFKEVLAK